MKYYRYLVVSIIVALFTTGCQQDDAQVAKYNMGKAANNFEIMRRVIGYNAIQDKIVMVTEGKCSIENDSFRVSIICKVGEGQYIRSFYGRSDNTTYFVEQMGPVPVNVYHYRRTFKPQAIIPDIDFRGDMSALGSVLTPDNND